MKTLIFLFFSGLCASNAFAQYRAAGPWTVTIQPVREKIVDEFAGRYLGWLPEDNANYFTKEDWTLAYYFKEQPVADTATAIRLRRRLNRVPWNVAPSLVTLFINCENPLTAPSGKQTDIRFVATGATLRLDPKQHLLWLAPSAPSVVLQAYQGQKLLFLHEFKVVPPPMPLIKCFASFGSLCDDCKPGDSQSASVRAVPENDFHTIMPLDARYRVAQMQLRLMRQGKEKALFIVKGQSFLVPDWDSIAHPGDQLQVVISLAQRQSFRGDVEDLPMKRSFNFPWPGSKIE